MKVFEKCIKYSFYMNMKLMYNWDTTNVKIRKEMPE